MDDTGMLKPGKHWVGVQRQYTGSAGTIANCQIAVSLSVATASEHVPIDFELYLPRPCTDEEARRADIPRGVVLGDAFYGRAGALRAKVRELGLEYMLSIDSDTLLEPTSKRGRAARTRE